MVSVLVAVVMCALAGALAYILVKPEPGPRRALFGVTFVLALIAAEFAGHRFVAPRVEAALAGPTLADDSLYRAIRKYEPDMYERLERDYKDAYRNGRREIFMQTAIREIGELAQKRLSIASNDSVHEFTDHMLVQLKELERQPGDACFRFLFPQVDGPADLSVLPKQMVARNEALLEAVIVSSAETPQQRPTESESMATLRPILEHMANTYGQDVQLMSRPGGSQRDRRRICEMAIDLYDQIMSLPKDDGANVMRFMVSKI